MIDNCGGDFFQDYYPEKLIYSLRFIKEFGGDLYLSGGAVRDIFLGAAPKDLDLTVSARAAAIAKRYAELVKGTYVLLDEKEDVARVVWRDKVIDFSSYREDSTTIEEDLACRDFTINALALPYDFKVGRFVNDLNKIIDPLNGRTDIKSGLIRQTSPQSFEKDPLRLLRAFRFVCAFDWQIEELTSQNIRERYHLINNVSVERINYELNLIMAAKKASRCFRKMKKAGLLCAIFPELAAGIGLEQPKIHHLDVMDHNIEALACLEYLLESPEIYFPDQQVIINNYLQNQSKLIYLKWAALFHDLGKPNSYQLRNSKQTFYNHDNIGADLVMEIAARLKWSNNAQLMVAKLIKHHMWPFHLNNSLKKTGIKARACLKIYKALGEDLTGLFLLAMADSLAAAGSDKPKDMEADLAGLFRQILSVIEEKIKPVANYPPVLNGRDLIENFSLVPGPIFGEILQALEKEQVVNDRMDRQEALAWVKEYLGSKILTKNIRRDR